MTLSRRGDRLEARVFDAAESCLAEQGYVSVVDVLAGIRWLDAWHLRRWRQGELACLEEAISTSPERLVEALGHLRSWATLKGLIASEAEYVARNPARTPLRLSADGDSTMERIYRTRWFSAALTDKQRQRLEAKANEPEELVVIDPLENDWRCHRCGGTGAYLIKESVGPSCLPCAGLGVLEFLPAGDAALTRRAKAKSGVSAVVVRFSRSRKRFERQGLLLESEALREAERELGLPPPRVLRD